MSEEREEVCSIEREPGEGRDSALDRPSGAIRRSLASATAVVVASLWCSFGEAANATVSANASHRAQERPTAFWNDFREAVRVHDGSAIARMTSFPFVVRWGNADENDPSISYDRKRFQDELARLLALKVAADNRTMAQVVEGTLRIAEADISSGTFMVGSFEFRLVGGTWRWTAAFTADPSFFPANESSPVPKVSPLRKILLDVTAEAARLKRPLKVSHLRSTGELAYLEAQEPGKQGRVVRAFLQRQSDSSQREMIWQVKHYSFQPADSDADWRSRIDSLVQSGVPASLFPAHGSDQGGHHGR
jgi:hypothetical protein